jgi:hypothetical protein
MKQHFAIAMLILFLALSSALTYLSNYADICTDCEYMVNPRMNAILNGQIEPPFNYRVLTPAIQYALGNSVWGLFLFHLLGNMALFGLCYAWVLRWRGNGLLALLLLFVFLQFSYSTWFDSDYALTEGVLLLFGWQLITGDMHHA